MTPLFTTLGLFIIDENRYPETWDRTSEHDVTGGGGPYAAVGARIIVGNRLASKVSGIIDMGHDFPLSIKHELSRWNSGLVFRLDPSRATSRGVNIYDENHLRHFEYLTPKRRIEAHDIIETQDLLKSSSFHMCCGVERCHLIVSQFNHLRDSDSPPLYMFEPSPPDCIPENYESLTALLPSIDIFSPNLEEACAFLNLLPHDVSVQDIAARFAAHLSLPYSAIVLRCGARGCFVQTASGMSFSLPAYHQSQDTVVDVTGGGNLFCGAFMAAYVLTNQEPFLSAVCGILALGCVVETLGMPQLVAGNSGGCELWNGVTLHDRFTFYKKKNPQLMMLRSWNDFSWFAC